jgi:hypothetical protein
MISAAQGLVSGMHSKYMKAGNKPANTAEIPLLERYSAVKQPKIGADWCLVFLTIPERTLR